LIEQMNSCSGQRISHVKELQALVSQIAASVDQGDAAVEAMDRDVTAFIKLLRGKKPVLWARIMGRAL
jgi:hypothetical protein